MISPHTAIDGPSGFLDRLDAIAAPAFGPVRMGDRVSGRIDHEEPSAAWKSRLAGAWWSTAKRGNVDRTVSRQIYGLGRGLLAFGGAETCLPREDAALDLIISRGQLWSGADAVFRQSPCRQSPAAASRDLWLTSLPASDTNAAAPRSIVIPVVGYALHDDGIWRQHAWCIDAAPDAHGVVVDSVGGHLLYFGAAHFPGRDFLFRSGLENDDEAGVAEAFSGLARYVDIVMSDVFETTRVRDALKNIAEEGLGRTPGRRFQGHRILTPKALGLSSGLA